MSFLICNDGFLKRFSVVTFDEIQSLIIEKQNPSDFYFVAATNHLAMNFKLNFADKYYSSTGKPLVNFTISNLEGLVERIFDIVKPENVGAILSDSYRFLIFKEAFDRANLSFFRLNNQKVSLFVIKWLSQIIFGLKEDGITVENFEKEMEPGNESIKNLPKFIDTKILFSEYQRLLQESKLFDIVDAIKYASKWLRDNLERSKLSNSHPKLSELGRETTFLFFGFYDFKVPEIEFIGELSRYENPLAIFLDFDEKNGPLFGNYIDLIKNLKNYGLFSLSLEKEYGSLENNVSFLKKYLFNNFLGVSRPELAKNLKILATENKYVEAKLISKLCKYLILVKNYKPSDICITTKDPQGYASLFREVFQDVGVPVNIMERFKLSSSPLILSILSALNVVARGFRFSDIRKVLLSFYFRFGTYSINGNFVPIDVENFLAVASSMKGLGGEELGGKNYWLRRFENRLKAIDDRISFLKSSEYPDQTEILNLQREKKQLEKARDDFLILLSYFDFENNNLSVDEFYDIILKKIIRRFGVLEILEKVVENLLATIKSLNRYDKISKIEEVEKDSRALSKFLDLLEEFVFITKSRYANRKFSLKELIELLTVVIFEERFQISRKPDYGITITTIEQTRGIPYKVMILCGAIDGVIPRKYSPEKFLGKELGKSEKRHFENERLEFFFFLTNNSELFNRNERLTYIFYPKRDAKREFVPTPFIYSLSDLLGERKSDVFFDLSSISNSCDESLEWINAVASKVEQNTISSIESDPKLNAFSKDIVELYFKKHRRNILSKDKLIKRTIDFIGDITSKPLSITFLEQYNKCPFKFFVDRILRLQSTEIELELFMTNREKGELLHMIAASFYKSLAEENLKNNQIEFVLNLGGKKYVPVKLNTEKETEYRRRIEEITKRILEKFNTEISLFEIDIEEFISSDPQKLGLVQLWLNYELKRAEWKTLPTLFEFSFGMGKDEGYEAIEIELAENERIKLRGKIDRIDIYIQEENLEYSIIDYKFSQSEAVRWLEVFQGTAFQLPFYSIAFTKLLEKYVNKNITAINLLNQIFNYKISKEKRNEKSLNYHDLFAHENSDIYYYFKLYGKTGKHEELEAKLEIVKNIALNTLRAIKSELNYPVKPKNEFYLCSNCQFKRICKKEIY